MNDALDAVGRAPETLRVGGVTFRELATPRLKPSSALHVTNECAHVVIASSQGMNNLRPDEACPAGDQNPHPAPSKFFQYRLGVGPRWPWYFEPRPALPYGVEAGSVSWTNEIWPIFIP